MSAEGAFWLFDGRAQAWRFFLVTSLFDQIGPRAIYLRLNEALKKKLSETETKSFMVYLGSPRENLAKAIRVQCPTAAQASEVTKLSLKLDGRRQQTWVYRMAPQMSETAAKLAQSRFTRLYKEIMAA